jgi:hypothetical protein
MERPGGADAGARAGGGVAGGSGGAGAIFFLPILSGTGRFDGIGFLGFSLAFSNQLEKKSWSCCSPLHALSEEALKAFCGEEALKE